MHGNIVRGTEHCTWTGLWPTKWHIVIAPDIIKHSMHSNHFLPMHLALNNKSLNCLLSESSGAQSMRKKMISFISNISWPMPINRLQINYFSIHKDCVWMFSISYLLIFGMTYRTALETDLGVWRWLIKQHTLVP